MPKAIESLEDALEAVMPRRQARVVEEYLCTMGIHDLADLNERVIPAHIGTDLRGVTAVSISRLDAIVRQHGGRLSR